MNRTATKPLLCGARYYNANIRLRLRPSHRLTASSRFSTSETQPFSNPHSTDRSIPVTTTAETPNFSDSDSSSSSFSSTTEDAPRYETPRPGAKYEDQQTRVLQASLPYVIKLGWTEAALIAGARDVGLSPSIVGSLPRRKQHWSTSRDIFDAEMRQFGRLRNVNVFTPLAYHYRREEKLFITENMPKGSLLYILHGDRGSSHADLNWPIRLNIVKGIARGLSILYTEFSSEDLPHGNLKCSNIVPTDTYEPLLSDYAFHPLVNPNYAIQTMFAYKTPDYVVYQQVSQMQMFIALESSFLKSSQGNSLLSITVREELM